MDHTLWILPRESCGLVWFEDDWGFVDEGLVPTLKGNLPPDRGSEMNSFWRRSRVDDDCEFNRMKMEVKNVVCICIVY